jgi:hypothetical protein
MVPASLPFCLRPLLRVGQLTAAFSTGSICRAQMGLATALTKLCTAKSHSETGAASVFKPGP